MYNNSNESQGLRQVEWQRVKGGWVAGGLNESEKQLGGNYLVVSKLCTYYLLDYCFHCIIDLYLFQLF